MMGTALRENVYDVVVVGGGALRTAQPTRTEKYESRLHIQL